jgi:hypothetical protein
MEQILNPLQNYIYNPSVDETWGEEDGLPKSGGNYWHAKLLSVYQVGRQSR